MIVFRTLGMLDLRDHRNVEIRSVLQQPKRLALLAFLTIALPRRYHRRDSLFAMFWPELDEEHARAALRRSLHFLRAALGAPAIEGRGEEEVHVPTERLWCDAVAFEQALRSGNLAAALELYGGDMLEGFHVSDAPAFQDWLDRERSRLREAAARGAWSLAEAAEQADRGEEAGRWGRRAFDLTPSDEEALCRVLRLLHRVGARSAAISAYDNFARRLTLENDLKPSPETLALVEAIRTRPARLNRGNRGGGVEEAETLAQAEVGGPPKSSIAPIGPGDEGPASELRTAPRWRRWILPAAAAATLATSAVGGLIALLDRSALDPKRVVVAAFQNRTGRDSLGPLGLIAADWIGRGLSETRLVEVVDASAAFSPGLIMLAGRTAADGEGLVEQLSVETKADIVVAGSYYRQSDSLYFEVKVINAADHEVLAALAAGADQSQPLAAIEALRQRLMVALAFRLDSRLRDFPAVSQPPTYAAYRYFVEGLALHINRDYRRASQEFLKAAASDSQFRAPVIFAAVDHFNLGHDNSNLQEFATADSLAQLVADHQERLTPIEVAMLDWLRAKLAGDQLAALDVSRRFAQLAPGTLWEYQGAYDALQVNRPAEAVEILTRMDPDRGLLRDWIYYWSVLTVAYHLLGEHRQELRTARRARERYGVNLDVLALEMGALAALGRVRELEMRVEEAEMARPAVWATPGFVLMLVAEELRAHGYADASRDLLNRALTWYRGRTAKETATKISRAEYGEVLYAAEQWQPARRVFEDLVAEDSSMVPYKASLGLLAARRGDSAEADRISQDLAVVTTPYLFGHTTYVRACIASVLGRRDQAVALLRQAFAQGLEYGMHALHFDPDLEPLRGYPSFQELLRPKP